MIQVPSIVVATVVVVGVTVIYLYRDISFTVGEWPYENAVFAKANSQETQAEQKQREYDEIKKKCDDQPWGNSCSAISRQIGLTEWCTKKFEDWDNKWLAGRHAEKIANWLKRIQNLKDTYKSKCTNK
jgi:hypothetical protein